MKHTRLVKKFLADPSFEGWAKGTDPGAAARWEHHLQTHPEERGAAEAARRLLLGLPFRKKSVPTPDIERNWKRLKNTLEGKPRRPPIRRWRRRVAVAALVIGALICAKALWPLLQEPEYREVQTLERPQTVELPDGSLLTLNTHSRARFQRDWAGLKVRRVELEGEGFFQVEKQPAGMHFEVQVKDLRVRVLGTAFNLNGKRKHPVLSLVEGQVSLERADTPPKVLSAGQTAWYDEGRGAFVVQEGLNPYWTAWTRGRWSFGRGTPFGEILKRIGATYGLTCVVTDSTLLERRASGEVSIESRQVLFESLSYLLDVEFQLQNDHLIVSPAAESER